MRTQRPDGTSPIGYPTPATTRAGASRRSVHLRDAGRRRIIGATSLSALGGTGLAVAFGALFAQSTAAAAPATPAPAPALTAVRVSAATPPPAPVTPRTAAVPAHSSLRHPTAPKVATTTDAVAPPTAAPKAAAPTTAASRPPAAASGAS